MLRKNTDWLSFIWFSVDSILCTMWTKSQRRMTLFSLSMAQLPDIALDDDAWPLSSPGWVPTTFVEEASARFGWAFRLDSPDTRDDDVGLTTVRVFSEPTALFFSWLLLSDLPFVERTLLDMIFYLLAVRNHTARLAAFVKCTGSPGTCSARKEAVYYVTSV